ncbi:hypothetical protein [Roseomonas xinghualingensis]|uniref:hypothetical protein n=1 Tax=Roseomonas xinghualingensis TaxID=2986475 RepID=UPI0021F2372E|nr:hypothetical protein [Roseomonas sp. SXEYE001]MCV4205950.1 hypothetical protein [Roseomonas sp. SXEYE001]
MGTSLLLLALLLLPGCAALLDGEAIGLLRAMRGETVEAVAPRREQGREADLWRPGEGGARAAIVLAPGFSEAARALLDWRDGKDPCG